MKPKVTVLIYGALTFLIEKNTHRFLDTIDIEVVNALLDDSLKIARQIEERKETDVFVCTKNAPLSQHVKSPIVEIEVTGYDLLLALKEAKKYSRDICIVTHNQIPYLNEILEILAVSVEQFNYNNHDPEEVEKLLAKLHEKGLSNVIGAGLVFDIAKQLGMNSTLIYSEDGVIRALATAASIALSKKEESEKAERFRIIMDFAHEG